MPRTYYCPRRSCEGHGGLHVEPLAWQTWRVWVGDQPYLVAAVRPVCPICGADAATAADLAEGVSAATPEERAALRKFEDIL